MSKFTHLHVHSHYSLLDGLSKIDELLDYVKELGMDSVALTDHGVLYGAVEFYKKAKERGIKPIIGCEVYMAYEKMEQKRPKIDDKKYHLVLLAKNEQGYKNLVQLVTKAHLEGFYYKPRIDEELLLKHSQGLIGMSACLHGKIPTLILNKKIEQAEKIALRYKKIFGKDNFYLELQHHPNLPGQQTVNDALISFSKKLDIPLVATNDCHYLRSEDNEAQDVLMLINTDTKADDPNRKTMKWDDYSIKNPKQMINDFKEVPEAIENTQKIKELCNFEFKLGEIKLPYFPLPEKENYDGYLKKLCEQGLEKRKSQITNRDEALKRLEYELSIIKQTGFASYFLIVQDFVNWAKENRIVVGPGRGSAAGSIVSYLLNITDINPLKYNLLFERFLNPSRISMPDIDLDFTDWRRDEVIEYIAQKYGRDKVAQIITFGTMAARAVIRDVGRALQYPYIYCDRIAKMIPFGFTLKQALERIDEFKQLYQSDEKAVTLIDLAKKLEGVVRHASTHACGVVISEKPLTELVPLQHPTQNDETIITQYEMHSIEDLGLLKMDLLGLKNLTIIEDTLARIYKVQNKSIKIEDIPLDDKKTYEILQKAQSTSVFQLESDGMKRYLKQLKPTEFEDIIAMVALYRPGPMQFISSYIKGKNNPKKIKYIHPKIEPILKNTYGIMVYQEQLMQVTQQLAGFSMAEADILRKAVGKKIKKLLLEQKEKFIKGATNEGVQKEIAEKIWEWILPFASYGFNRSHAASYAMIAYRTAYLKANYPVEFMAAALTSEKNDIEKIAFLIEECKKMGIEVLAPDINESFRNFSVVPEENKIRFGLLAIKNVGHNVVEAIVRERKEKGQFLSINDFMNRISSKDINKKSLESLIKTGAFDRFEERNKLLQNMEKLLEFSRETHKNKTNGQKGLFDSFSGNSQGKNLNNNSITLASAPLAAKKERLNWEKELLGLYITSHPLEDFKKAFEKKVLPLFKISQDITGKIVRIGGVICGIKKIIAKNGKPMLFVKLEDQTDKIELVVFPSIIEQNPTIFQENKIVMVKGRVDNRGGVPKIICNEIEEVVEES
ncbi:DNA polymerase III subunit alpha [Candidatus Parcubacteria bacterium]|nr:DNA polymerase III subunit alpha [Candidatus Parcubacteria bacterium]